MTDKELFLKYNHKFTEHAEKDSALANKLYNGQIHELDYYHVNLGLDNKWTILLTATYACNLNCIYCENAMLRKKYHNAVMTEDLVRQIIRKLGPHTVNITWHGGESTLLPDNLLEALEDERKKYGYDIQIDLQTNGILVTPEKEALYKKLGINWGTSFDGKWNDFSRGKKSTEAIKRLIKEHNGDVGFIIVTTNLNIDKLIENYEYYKELGVKSPIQNSLVRESQAVGSNDFIVANDIAIEKMLEYFDYWIHDTNNPIEDSYLNRQLGRVLGTAHTCEESPCIGGWLIMDPLGNITCCGGDASTEEDRYVNLNDITDYRDLLNNPKYIKALNRQQKLVDTYCDNCPWKSTCYGACLGTAYEIDKTYSTVNPRYCEFDSRFLTGIYEMIKDIPQEDLVETKYNKHFIRTLKENCFYNLEECRMIEEKRGVI